MLWQPIVPSPPAALVDGAVPFVQRWTLIHYRQLLSSDPPSGDFAEQHRTGLGSTVLTITPAIPAAYGLVRLPQRWLRPQLIGAALFPYVLLFLALLELARSLNLGNSLLASPFRIQPFASTGMLLLTAAFEGLPKDLMTLQSWRE